VRRQREFLQLLICNLATFSVDFVIKLNFYLQAARCRRTPNECEHHIEI
jgi:hypothetical protein